MLINVRKVTVQFDGAAVQTVLTADTARSYFFRALHKDSQALLNISRGILFHLLKIYFTMPASVHGLCNRLWCSSKCIR